MSGPTLAEAQTPEDLEAALSGLVAEEPGVAVRRNEDRGWEAAGFELVTEGGRVFQVRLAHIGEL